MADKYANIAVLQVVQTAADTLTFDALGLSLGIGKKEAWLINRIEYIFPKGPLQDLLLAADQIDVAITRSDNMDSLSLKDANIIHTMRLCTIAATADVLIRQPFAFDLTTLPGGGLLVLPNPLFLGVDSASMDAAVQVTARLYYQSIELKGDDYYELVEASRVQV